MEVERLDEGPAVLDLASTARAHEAAKLLDDCPPLLCGLLLHDAEGMQVTLVLEDSFHRLDAQRADQLVLQVGAADEEALSADAAALQSATDVALLALVAQTADSHVQRTRSVYVEVSADAPCTAHRDDSHSGGGEVETEPHRQCLDGDLIADALDEDHGAQVCVLGGFDLLHASSLPALVDQAVGMDITDLTVAAGRIATLLRERGETVGVAEGSAGGLISTALLSVPGASAYYLGGAVVYTRQAVRAFMAGPIEPPAGMRGATEGFATYLARSAAAQLGSTWALSEAGAAGPPNPYGDPAGHCWLAVSGPNDSITTRHVLTGVDDRPANMIAFAQAALSLLEETMSASKAGGSSN